MVWGRVWCRWCPSETGPSGRDPRSLVSPLKKKLLKQNSDEKKTKNGFSRHCSRCRKATRYNLHIKVFFNALWKWSSYQWWPAVLISCPRRTPWGTSCRTPGPPCRPSRSCVRRGRGFESRCPAGLAFDYTQGKYIRRLKQRRSTFNSRIIIDG